MTMTRTDTHRPSTIDPTEYYFVALGYQKCAGLEDVYAIAQAKAQLQAHMDRTGATFSRHRHGGNCHVCGTHCVYTAIFHHVPTNTLISTGLDCAEKLSMGDPAEFRTFRKNVLDAKRRKAGQAKAKVLLDEAGIAPTWDVYQLEEDPTDEPLWKCRSCNGRDSGCRDCEYCGVTSNSFWTIKDIVGKLVRYGSISEGQIELLRKLTDRVTRWPEIKAEREAKREAERAVAEDCPTGRVQVTGEVVSTKVQDSQYGPQYKMLVKDDRGFRVWGSVPSALQLFDDGEYQRGIAKGDRVTFTATIEPSKDDVKFGFYKRPTKASLTS